MKIKSHRLREGCEKKEKEQLYHTHKKRVINKSAYWCSWIQPKQVALAAIITDINLGRSKTYKLKCELLNTSTYLSKRNHCHWFFSFYLSYSIYSIGLITIIFIIIINTIEQFKSINDCGENVIIKILGGIWLNWIIRISQLSNRHAQLRGG